jgi:(S)-3,5-dihydroxyphenylglycine transaminase
MDMMNFLNEATTRYPAAISFAPGRPHEGLFDNEQIFRFLHDYLDYLAAQGNSPASIHSAMHQYGPTAGQICDIIADALWQEEGLRVSPRSIVVTVGAQEAMILVLRALMAGSDDVLLVSSPCYVGITGAATVLGVRVVPVDEGVGGLSSARLETVVTAQRAKGRRVRALYVVPDYANPSGTTMPVDTRRSIVEFAARENLLVIEDSPYRLISPGPRLPTLKSVDSHRAVVQIGSFSKTLFPGVRLGFAVADQIVVDDAGNKSLLADELAKIKSMVTLNTPTLSQAVVAGALLSSAGRISEISAGASAHYDRSMKRTLECLELHLPTPRRAELEVQWNEPSGGFFITMTVPFIADNEALQRSAKDFGVLWTPMSYFYPGGGGSRSIRLSISSLSETEIDEGVARLTRFIEAERNVRRAPVTTTSPAMVALRAQQP